MNADFGLPPGLPAGAVVDLDAIRANVGLLREKAGSAGVMAVVKADAYGHGLIPCARAALAGGASWLGVAQLSEGLALRAAGIEAPVLAWLTVPGDAYPAAVAAGVDIGISTSWALLEVAAAAELAGVAARVHLKIDTGLTRNGASRADWPDLIDAALKLQAAGHVRLVGVFSHFAYADDPVNPTVEAQTADFASAVDFAERRGAHFEVRHLANSAASLTNPATHFDLVRPGIAVYGLSPIPDLSTAAELGLQPAMTLLSRVANVKRVQAGQGVSYGHEYTTKRLTTVALLPIGYADGLPRSAGNNGPVLLAGQRHQVAGRVCMDQFVIDLSNQPTNWRSSQSGEDITDVNGPDFDDLAEVQPGDIAVVFGAAAGQPSVEDWADAAGTISYEIVSRLGPRLPRIYIGRGADHG